MCGLRQVKASAGAGKTYELTRCFLQHMMRCACSSVDRKNACTFSSGGSDSWSSILGITFTNAAAAEMRDRVILSLKRAAFGKQDFPFLTSRKVAEQWVDAIMLDMSALNIRTIDSLLHLIVRAAALELGLPPDFQPVFATEEALSPYLDLLLDQAWRGDERVRNLLRDICRAIASRESSTGFLAGDKLLRELRPLLDNVLTGVFDNVATAEMLRHHLDEIVLRAVTSAGSFRELALSQGLVFTKDAQALVDAIAEGRVRNSALLSRSDASTLFLKRPMVDVTVQQAFEDFVAAGRQMVSKVPVLRQSLSLNPLLALADTLATAFVKNQRQEGYLPGILIPHMAREVLQGELGVPDALCRLGTRLTHFLVDEFQDTSRDQWLALRPLVEEALSRGGSMTWVGDVKQSIYGWRGGDPELFDSIFEDVGLTALVLQERHDSLPYNWRSRREIVQHNNSIFAPLARQDMAEAVMKTLLPADVPPEIIRDSSVRLARAFAGTEQQCPRNSRDGGLIQVETVHALDTAALNEAVLERLSCLLHEKIAPGIPWSDVLILVRKNANAALVAARLAHEGIPVITENSLLLATHPFVIQTVALLSFLDNPDDNIAFMTVIKGALFREHPETCELLNENWEAWCAEQGRGPLYRYFLRQWPHIWQGLLAPFFYGSGFMTPYDITLEWYERLGIEQRYPEAESFLRRFMEVVFSAEEKGLSTLSTFLDYWHTKGGEEKVPMPESMDAVRVMTIHKSKGLEAPVVIMPWTDFRARVDASPMLIELDGLRIVTGNRKHLGQPYYAELARQCRENMHMLYVAFTRARDALYIFHTSAGRRRGSTADALNMLMSDAGHMPPYVMGSLPMNNGNSTAQIHGGHIGEEKKIDRASSRVCVVNASAADFVHMGMRHRDDNGEESAKKTTDAWRPMKWLPQLKIFRNPLSGFTFRPEDRGNLLHLCLEHLPCTGTPEANALAALHAGLDLFPMPISLPDAEQESLLKALRWFASQPETEHWLREGWPEHSLMDAAGHTLRVDLLINEPWGPLVLEYKSGHTKAEHIVQVRNYLDCLVFDGAMGTPRGLIAYLDMQKFVLVDRHEVSEPVDCCSALLSFGESGS
ncbi:MAG: UvrD-helicase domain-containing protein [Desulfovibrio sp.]|nr:UvrD-helicase domain-containing protein [Desulfovibrio sp.]